MKPMVIIAAILIGVLVIFSYGFIDPNLTLSTHPVYTWSIGLLTDLVYRRMAYAAILYLGLVLGMFILYRRVFTGTLPSVSGTRPLFILAIALFLSYPAFSYDLFNYILTAKVTYLYHENPYIVMPIEIPNEPGLSYTRAANKVALYGPSWIALTMLPHYLSFGNIVAAIVSFKLLAAGFYLGLVFLIYRTTRNLRQTLFFALNPLVLIEVLVSGHNDVVMMALGIAGLLLWHKKNFAHKSAGVALFMLSVFVKGATVALLPLFFLPAPASKTSGWTWERKAAFGFWLMFIVFLLSPLREEMYPWYAVWWLSFAAFIPMRKDSFVHGFSYWLTLGLMLRYVPWIATREYGGVTPPLRIVATIVPVGIYMLTRLLPKFAGKSGRKK